MVRLCFVLVTLLSLHTHGKGQSIRTNLKVEIKGLADINVIVQDVRGNYIIAGSFDQFESWTSSKQTDTHSIAKVDENGELVDSFHRAVIEGMVKIIKALPNGQLLIAGNFLKIDGIDRNQVARLNADGTLDSAFNIIHNFDQVAEIGYQSNGKLIVSGNSDDSTSPEILRYNSDGGNDPTFSAGLNQTILFLNDILIDHNDRIIVGGNYYNSQVDRVQSRVLRLLPNGEPDPSFSIGIADAGFVYDLGILATGKLVVCGTFTQFNSINSKYIALLDSSGNVQADFAGNVDQKFDLQLNSLCILRDDRIIVIGYYTNYNNEAANCVTLNQDGSLDKIIALTSSNDIRSVYCDTRGRVLLGGRYNYVYGENFSYIAPRKQLTRFSNNFSPDDSFQPLFNCFSKIKSIESHADGQIYVGGNWFDLVNVKSHQINNLQRFKSNGVTDYSFNITQSRRNITSIVAKTDGKILVGDNVGVEQLYQNGTNDDSFNQNSRLFYSYSSINLSVTVDEIILSRDKIFAGGYLSGHSSGYSPGIVKLNMDGSPSNDFASQLPDDPFTSVNRIRIQADQKVLISGSFPNGQLVTDFLIRLNQDGSIDNSFNKFHFPVNDFEIDSAGRIVIAATFFEYNGVRGNGVVRLKSDGSYDESFKITSYAGMDTKNITGVDILPGDHIIATGQFSSFNGNNSSAIVHLDSRGNEIPIPSISFLQNTTINSARYENGVLYLAGGLYTKDYQSSVGIIDFTAPQTTISLQAVPQSSSAVLHWSTTSIQGVEGFILERAIIDADQDFVIIDSVTNINDTTYEDASIRRGNSYVYRISAYNSIGKSKYSNWAEIIELTPPSIQIFPNPISRNLFIENSSNETINEIRLSSASGSGVSFATTGNNKLFELDLGYLASGLYIISIQTDNEIFYKKIIKK